MTAKNGRCVVQLANGRRIVTPAYPIPCHYVLVQDEAGEEIAYWASEEWKEDPEGVMGAIIGAMKEGDICHVCGDEYSASKRCSCEIEERKMNEE